MGSKPACPPHCQLICRLLYTSVHGTCTYVCEWRMIGLEALCLTCASFLQPADSSSFRVCSATTFSSPSSFTSVCSFHSYQLAFFPTTSPFLLPLILIYQTSVHVASSNGDVRFWDLRKIQAASTFHTMNSLYLCESHPSAPLLAWYVLQWHTSLCCTRS